MSYTYSITSKGQITLPKEFRTKLQLDKYGKATMSMKNNQIIITAPKTLQDIRNLLATKSTQDPPSNRERTIGRALAKKYNVS